MKRAGCAQQVTASVIYPELQEEETEDWEMGWDQSRDGQPEGRIRDQNRNKIGEVKELHWG